MATARLSVDDLERSLGDVLDRAELHGDRTIIRRCDKDAAVIVPLDDLRLLEQLVRDAEDRDDLLRSEAARAESDDRVPYAAVRARLGLTDGDREPALGA